MYPASSFVTGEDNRRQLEKSMDMWEQRCLAMVEGHGTAVCNVMMQLIEKRINEWEAGAVAAALWAARLHQSFASKTCFFAALVMQHRGVMQQSWNAADDEIDSSPRHGKPKLALARRGASLAAPGPRPYSP